MGLMSLETLTETVVCLHATMLHPVMIMDQTSETANQSQFRVFIYNSCCGHWCLSAAIKTLTKTEWGVALADLAMILVGGLWTLGFCLEKKLNGLSGA